MVHAFAYPLRNEILLIINLSFLWILKMQRKIHEFAWNIFMGH